LGNAIKITNAKIAQLVQTWREMVFANTKVNPEKNKKPVPYFFREAIFYQRTAGN